MHFIHVNSPLSIEELSKKYIEEKADYKRKRHNQQTIIYHKNRSNEQREKYLQQLKTYRDNHKEERLITAKKYYENNREKVKNYQVQRYNQKKEERYNSKKHLTIYIE
jgi:hypothetical protein